MKLLLLLLLTSMLGVGCSEEKATDQSSVIQSLSLLPTIEDKFWLITEIVDSNSAILFEYSSDDFFRYTIRFRSDSFYELNAYCDQRGGSYSINGNTATVTPPMISAVFDCAPFPEVSSFNDINNRELFSVLIELYQEEVFQIEIINEELFLEAEDNRIFAFRECVFDCFVQR